LPLKRHTLPNGMTVTFGRLQPKREFKGARFANAVNVPALPAPPPWVWNPKNLAMNAEGLGNILANNQYGCCTDSGMGHLEDDVCGESGNPDYVPVTAEQVLWAYSQTTNPPFNPTTGANDNGADEVTVLDWWRDHGFFQDGTGKIVGYASVDPTNVTEVKQAAWLGRLYLGVCLPDEWLQVPMVNGTVWPIAGNPNPNNGHCIVVIGYNSKGLLVDSWGIIFLVPWIAVAKYFSQSAGGAMFVVFSQDAINKASGKAPNGFDAAQLTAYLQSFSA
jgi:hypothetical protein